ncbi:MAG: Ig-like domain-containing protein, partial [bacterium]
MSSPEKASCEDSLNEQGAGAFKLIWLLMLVELFALSLVTQPAQAQQCTSQYATVGYRDFDYFGGSVTSEPTEEKPESKLWYNDGFWWGILWDPVAREYRIHRFDLANQCWINVGPDVDERPRSAQDVLWDGQKLYIASHAKLTHTSNQGPTSGRVYRYSYSSLDTSYSLDPAFPVVISDNKTRAMVLTKDSAGKLWVTWTQPNDTNSAGSDVMLTNTDGNDLNWSAPFVLPAEDSNISSSDIASIIAFGGDKIGVLWGNQNTDLDISLRKYYFAVHNDSDPPLVWQPKEDVLPGILPNGSRRVADDHINLATCIDSGPNNGSVLAAMKTGLLGTTSPRVVVAKRDASGTWTYGTFSTGAEDHTRPSILYDSGVDSVYVFAKSDNFDNKIFMKSTHIDNLTFPPGFGRVFIQGETGNKTNNPTSTKQCVNPDMGMLVLASDKIGRYYFHNYLVNGNAPPVALDDSVFTHEGTAVDINVTANDTDSDGIDPATVGIVAAPDNGTPAVDATTGIITYTPDSGFSGTDTFVYAVRDNKSVRSNPATVTVTVNALPVAGDDAVTTDEDVAISIDVLANDSDSDGTIDSTTVTVVTPPDSGTVLVNDTTGVIKYTPNQNFNGADTLTYTVQDNNAGTSNAATVIVTVLTVNDLPVAADDSASTDNATPVVIDVTVNDTDLDGTIDPSTVTVVTPPGGGNTSVNTQTGEITYTATPGFFGTDTLWYTVDDSDGGTSNAAKVTITVNAVPIALDDTTMTDENVPVEIDVLANDNDPDGFIDSTTVTIATLPGHGDTSIHPLTGVITYTPDSGYLGSDTFTYTVDDKQGSTSSPATVFLHVNGPPFAGDDQAVTIINQAVDIDILNNDFDPDGGTIDSSSVSIVVGPFNGTTSVNPTTGVVTFTPGLDFLGQGGFGYTVSDDDGSASNVATVSVTVTSPPTANNDSATTDEDTPVDINVAANDVDVDGSIADSTVSIVTS